LPKPQIFAWIVQQPFDTLVRNIDLSRGVYASKNIDQRSFDTFRIHSELTSSLPKEDTAKQRLGMNHAACSTSELWSFIKAQTGEDGATGNLKEPYMHIFTDLDQHAVFGFFDLAPEPCNVVYRELVPGMLEYVPAQASVILGVSPPAGKPMKKQEISYTPRCSWSPLLTKSGHRLHRSYRPVLQSPDPRRYLPGGSRLACSFPAVRLILGHSQARTCVTLTLQYACERCAHAHSQSTTVELWAASSLARKKQR